MLRDDLSRRRFVGVLAAGTLGGAAALWLGALDAPTLAAQPSPGHADETWRGERLTTLTAAQAADLDAFADQIVPSDADGPGAREAGSVFFIDRSLGSFAREQRPLFTTGLAELREAASARGARSFAALPAAQQTAVLQQMETARSEFFGAARAAVIVGLLADPKYGGNRGRIGWRILGFEDRFHWTAPFGWYDREADHGR